MLTPKHIETFCRWWSLEAKRPINSGTFFAHAFHWKFKELREKEMTYAYVAYMRSGYIPEYVKEYWRARVLPFICIKGGVP